MGLSWELVLGTESNRSGKREAGECSKELDLWLDVMMLLFHPHHLSLLPRIEKERSPVLLCRYSTTTWTPLGP